MSVLINKQSKVLVQGFTGREGSFHAGQMIAYGTDVVGGVTPGKGGRLHLERMVYDTVAEAVIQAEADTSIIFVPAAMAADAVIEAALAGIGLVICITEGIPVADMTRVIHFLKTTSTRLVGPNCPGVISPGQAKAGIMPSRIHRPGTTGIVSRSGTLTYVAVDQITSLGLGQSTCIGIGGDPLIGTTFVDVLELFRADPGTEAVVMIGEIGGHLEEEAAEYMAGGYPKPIIAFIAGRSAPPGRRMGHAGAIVSGGQGTAAEKMAALRRGGALVVDNPTEIGAGVLSALGRK